MKTESFFLVWTPTAGFPPTKQHKSFAEAKSEAEHLAKATSHNEFFVLAAVSVSRKVLVETELLRSDFSDGISI